METFSALLAICAGNSPVPGEFPAQRPVTRSFDVFFDLHPNKRLSKQWWGWWFGTPPCPLWRHRNVMLVLPWWFIETAIGDWAWMSNISKYANVINHPGPVFHQTRFQRDRRQLIYWGWDTVAICLADDFYFLGWKASYVDSNFTEFCSYNCKSALVQKMAWHWVAYMPLS